jgi:hypothetical protein
MFTTRPGKVPTASTAPPAKVCAAREGVRRPCGRAVWGGDIDRASAGRERAVSGPRSGQRSLGGHLAFPWVTWGRRGP